MIITLIGPTSTGKTSLAIELCKKFNGEIISADSRQIYKYMDIGTGKLPIKQTYKIEKDDDCWIIDNVQVWGYDLATPAQIFSVWEYAKYARNKINDILDRGKIPFLVGGTGMYIEATLGLLKLESYKTDPRVRQELNKLDLEGLQNKYRNLGLPKSIDFKNPARLRSAIERKLSKPTNNKLPDLNIDDFKIFGLTDSRENLYKKVDVWAETIWKGGLLGEAKFLEEKFGPRNNKLNGLVYKSAINAMKNPGENDKELQKMKYALHAYIRRQQTWFKKMQNIIWIDKTKSNAQEVISIFLLELRHG